MASTDLITYLNYISTLETESDTNINTLISEQNLFIKLDSFESDSIVENEFSTLVGIAHTVRDDTIAADAIQMSADAAAVAAIWSFGLGMAAFAALEVSEQILRAQISKKSGELNKKLKTIDTDISSQINPDVNNYVIQYKANNNLIASKAPSGLDTSTCRSLLMQFMAEVQRHTTLDVASFKTYAESARIVYNSSEINKVYDALDTLNLSGKTDEDVKNFMDVLVSLNFPTTQLSLVRNFAIAIMFYKLKIANETIQTQAREAGLPVEEVDANAFEAMDAVGKFVTGVAVLMSVVDVVLNIIDIVDVVEQCNVWCDKLNSTIKESYKSYFNGIKTASQQYKAAISGNPPSPSPQPKPQTPLVIYIKGIETTDNCPHVFAIGTDNTLYLNWRDSSGGWSGWGANWNNAPKLANIFAIETTDNCPHVFGIGTDNTLYLNWRDSSGGWSGWGANWNNAPKLANIFAIETTDNCPHVFGIGTDNTLYLNWRNSSGQWSGWIANWA